MNFEPAITAIIEACVDVAEMDAEAYRGQGDTEASFDALVRPQFSVQLERLASSPRVSENADRRFIRATISIETVYKYATEERIDEETRRLLLARAPTVAEAVRNALLTSDTLTSTLSGALTYVVSGCCLRETSSSAIDTAPERNLLRWRQEFEIQFSTTRATTA